MGYTKTAAGTTGAQTINRFAGTVNAAAGSTSLVLTNSLITVNTVMNITIQTNDATLTTVQAVPAAGSCTFYYPTATGETSLGWSIATGT